MGNPDRWGLPLAAVESLGEDLHAFWTRYRPCLRTRTRDTSANAYLYWRGQLSMEDQRNFANIDRRLQGGDGQSLQQFMSDSPWRKQAVFDQIQAEVRAHPALQSGGLLVLDESSDETAGLDSAGAGRQHNGRLGKLELSVTTVGLTYIHPATATWVLIDGELFLPEAWFTPAYAERRAMVDLPAERGFLTKPQLGLAMLQRVQASGLSIALLACDDLYGKSRDFRVALDAAHVTYAAEVPGSTQVYLQCPKIGVSRRRPRGKPPTKLKVLSRQVAHEARALARSGQVTWQRVVVRPSERGDLIADFAVRSIWTLTNDMQARQEWLVMRRDSQSQITYTLLNAPEATPESVLIQHACQRYFTERLYEDAKSELGWADLQARKYLAWEHHTALTAAATWFVAEEKLKWRATYARDPDLAQQLAVDVLPALSTANVRDLLQAVLPVPQLTPQQARELVTTHLVNRARSTASRLKKQHSYDDSG